MLRAIALPHPNPAAPGLHLSIIEGCFAMLPQTFTGGVFLTGFALMLGADPWALGLLAAIPALGMSAQLLTPLLLARGVARKGLTVTCASASRYLWVAVAAIPFLPLPLHAQLGLFFVLLALSTLLGQVAGAAWSDWMADLVPDSQRGRYFGLRNAVCAIVAMALMGAGSWFLDAFADGQRRWGFVALVAAAVVGAIASQAALARQPEIDRARPRRAPFKAPLANRPFMRMTLMMFVWTLMIGLTGPFCYAFALKDLHLGYGLVGTHALIVAGLSIVSQPLWGRVIDRKGAQFALLIAMAPVCFNPLYWATMRPDFLAPLWLDALASGLFWPGVALATTALLMEVAPKGERAGYMSLFNAGMGVAACLAAVAGGAILARLDHQLLPVAGFTLTAWQALLLFGVCARLVCFAAILTLPRLKAPVLMIETWPGGLVETELARTFPGATDEAARAV